MSSVVASWGNNVTAVPSHLQNADVSMVRGGEAHAVALLSNGSVRCWGDNTNSQTTVPAVVDNKQAVLVAAGGNVSAAVMSDETVYAWGSDQYGLVTALNNKQMLGIKDLGIG